MIITMRTTVPLPHNLTVKELIKVLEMVPDQNARVNAAHSSGDRFSSDAYRLEVSWTSGVEGD